MDEARAKLKRLSKVKETLGAMVVLVEGKNDVRALARAGFAAENAIAVSGRNVEELCSGFDGKRVAIMTDFDAAGRKLAARLYESLRSNGAKPDLECRFWMRRLFGIHTFEDLPAAVQQFEEKIEIERGR